MRRLTAAAATFFLLFTGLWPALRPPGAHGRPGDMEMYDSPGYAALKRQLMKEASLGRWGGIYVRGSGLDGEALLLHPDGRFAYVHDSDTGVMARREGIIRPRGDRLFLGKKAYRLIPWGERTYLIADRELEAFADAIDRGDEPRFDHWGRFYLRLYDDEKAAPGVPALPLGRAPRSRAVAGGRPYSIEPSTPFGRFPPGGELPWFKLEGFYSENKRPPAGAQPVGRLRVVAASKKVLFSEDFRDAVALAVTRLGGNAFLYERGEYDDTQNELLVYRVARPAPKDARSTNAFRAWQRSRYRLALLRAYRERGGDARDPTRLEDDPVLVRAARARLDAESPGWEEEERRLRAAWSASD